MNTGALLAGLFSGILGAMGLGGGSVLVIYLAGFKNVPQLKSQGINLIFFIPTALAAVIIYSVKKQIKWKVTLSLALGGLIGAVGGIYFAEYIGGKLTAKIFGGLLVLMGIREIFCSAEKTLEKKKEK